MTPEIPRPTISNPESCQREQTICPGLAHAIQDASEARGSSNHTIPDRRETAPPDRALFTVDDELSGPVQDIAHLSRTQITMLANKNSLKQLAPISRLPTELLSQVFLLVVRICFKKPCERQGDDYIYPTALASVCRAWYKAAVSLPSLWSHIDLPLNGRWMNYYMSCAQIWAERAKNHPLSIDLRIIALNAPDMGEVNALILLSFLAPLAKQIVSICIRASPKTRVLAQQALACCIKHGSSGTLRLLKASIRAFPPADLQPWDMPAVGSFAAPSQAQTETHFHSVQYLELSGFYIPWTSTTYLGLACLELDGDRFTQGGYQITQTQLAVILQSSLGLRSLRFCNVEVQSEEWPESKAITLTELETIHIEGNSHDILPLLAPGSKPIKMTFFSNQTPESPEILRSFFARSIVESLRMDGDYEPERWFLSTVGPIKHLKTLLISNCSFDDDDLNNFLLNQHNNHPIPWPKLTTLYLSRCHVMVDLAHQLLSLHSIQTLRLNHCTVADDPPSLSEPMDESLWLTAQLSKVVPDTALFDDHKFLLHQGEFEVTSNLAAKSKT
ncbi:hypothetical protein BDV93DRAFT_521971 [Ceratobasidium sp. AG-I]|nr:hypothetical protein BDV93DRAFT_521971 [Ceratobasidium sp. AG-I]